MATYKNLFNKTVNDLTLYQAIYNFTYHVKEKKFSLGNKKSMESFWNLMMDYLFDNASIRIDGRLAGFETIRIYMEKNYGIGNPESLINAMEGGLYEEMSDRGFYVENILNKLSKKYGKIGKEWIRENGIGENVGIDYYEEDLTDVDRIVIVRNKYGEGGESAIKRYKIKGEWSKTEQQAVKAAYALETGINYFQVRPCLYPNWIQYDDERKIRTNI